MTRRHGNRYKNDRGLCCCCCFFCLFPIAFTRYNCSISRLNSQPDEQDESGSISVVDEILQECSLTFGIGKEVGSKGMLFR